MKKILVLEDSPIRVDQLKDWFPEAEITWYTNVKDFLNETSNINSNKYDLIIFDHDLGSFKYENGEILDEGLLAYDCDGLTGFDAARMLEVVYRCPVLVWSYNKLGANYIAKEVATCMSEKKVYIAPFSKNYEYKKMILDIMDN